VGRGLALVLALAGCRTVAPGAAETASSNNATLQVTQLALEFSEPGEGTLLLVVPASRTVGASLTWELALDGHTFASGVEARPRVTADGNLEVRTPLAWKHLRWREGARYIDVRVRGEVHYLGLVEVERFEGRREVTSLGGPVFDSANE
jgi:hypothetical protein